MLEKEQHHFLIPKYYVLFKYSMHHDSQDMKTIKKTIAHFN